MGGESGCAAAADLRLAFEAAVEDGERMKIRKPIERIPARTSVIGLVRRIARGKAMAIGREKRSFKSRCGRVSGAPSSLE